jgi:hypothetical protein
MTMEKTGEEIFLLEGPSGALRIKARDKLARQFAMLFEGECLGLGPTKAAKKYRYSKQRYFQLRRAFQEGGTAAILPKKTGPKTNYVRTDHVVNEIVAHRFLDPEANSEVIAQKMRQTGFRVSTRSVERTLAERRLQKKTLPVSPEGQRTTD